MTTSRSNQPFYIYQCYLTPDEYIDIANSTSFSYYETTDDEKKEEKRDKVLDILATTAFAGTKLFGAHPIASGIVPKEEAFQAVNDSISRGRVILKSNPRGTLYTRENFDLNIPADEIDLANVIVIQNGVEKKEILWTESLPLSEKVIAGKEAKGKDLDLVPCYVVSPFSPMIVHEKQVLSVGVLTRNPQDALFAAKNPAKHRWDNMLLIKPHLVETASGLATHFPYQLAYKLDPDALCIQDDELRDEYQSLKESFDFIVERKKKIEQNRFFTAKKIADSLFKTFPLAKGFFGNDLRQLSQEYKTYEEKAKIYKGNVVKKVKELEKSSDEASIYSFDGYKKLIDDLLERNSPFYNIKNMDVAFLRMLTVDKFLSNVTLSKDTKEMVFFKNQIASIKKSYARPEEYRQKLLALFTRIESYSKGNKQSILDFHEQINKNIRFALIPFNTAESHLLDPKKLQNLFSIHLSLSKERIEKLQQAFDNIAQSPDGYHKLLLSEISLAVRNIDYSFAEYLLNTIYSSIFTELIQAKLNKNPSLPFEDIFNNIDIPEEFNAHSKLNHHDDIKPSDSQPNINGVLAFIKEHHPEKMALIYNNMQKAEANIVSETASKEKVIVQEVEEVEEIKLTSKKIK